MLDGTDSVFPIRQDSPSSCIDDIFRDSLDNRLAFNICALYFISKVDRSRTKLSCQEKSCVESFP